MKKQIKNGQFHLKPTQVKKLINGAENPRDRIIISLLYYCGLRRAEVVSIQTGDINHETKILTVKGKGGKKRFVPVPDDLLTEIKFYLGKSDRPYIFSAVKKRREPLVAMVVNRVVRAAGEAAGLQNPNPDMKGINPHLLRHSAARRLKDEGVSLEVISHFLGHEKLSITMETYGLKSFDEIVSSVSKVMV